MGRARTVTAAIQAFKVAVEAADDHVIPIHNGDNVHQVQFMQIFYQSAAALGSADDFNISGLLELLGNLVSKLTRNQLFIADFPNILLFPIGQGP